MKRQVLRTLVISCVIAAFIAVLVWYFFSIHLVNQSYRNVITMDTGWEITAQGETVEDQDLTLFTYDHPTVREETTVMRNTIPTDIPRVSTLRVLIYLSTITVSVDGREIYDYGTDLAAQGEFVGSGYHFVMLPEDSAGKELEIKVTACSNGAMSNLPAPKILPTVYVYEEFYDENIVSICCCIFLFTLGIILTVLGLLAMTREMKFAPLIHIGIFSLLIGYWALCNTKIIELYSVDLAVNTQSEYMSLYYALIPLLALLLVLRKSAAKWKRIMLTLQMLVIIIFAVGATVLHVLKIVEFPEVISIFHGLALAEAIGMLVTALQFGEKRTTSQKILNAAIFEILLVGIADILRFNIQKYILPDVSHIDTSVLPFGVLVFILLLIISYVVQYHRNAIDEAEKETLTRLAYQDTLTNLYNRSLSERVFADFDASDKEYTLINLDLNGLKKVNDGFGHAQGDQLIKDFAEILKKSYSEIGTVARMGGDEFAVMIDDTVPESEIHRAVEKMIREEEKLSWIRDYEISSSYGIARHSELPEGNAEQVYKLADERMYDMKVRTKKARTD